jgi:hypothetical protein
VHTENTDGTLVCSIKESSIQLECVSKAYIKDLMYLKRNTKFLPDRWGLKTSPASQSSLNEIVFPFTRTFGQITSQRGFFEKWLKLALRFLPKSERIRPNCRNYQIRSLLGKKRIANFNHFLKNPLCEVI